MTGEELAPKLLVVHPGGLGDLVLLSELIASLKQAHPQSSLTLICRSEFTTIVDCYPVRPDKVIGLPFQPYSCAEVTAELEALLRDLLSQLAGTVGLLVDAPLRRSWLAEFLAAALQPAVAVHCSLSDCSTALLSLLLERFGFARFSFRALDLAPGTPERGRYRRFADFLRIPFIAVFPWSMPAGPAQHAADWLHSHGLARGRYLVCAPFGSISTIIKRWPTKFFIDLLRQFFLRSAWPVLLMGDRPDQESLISMQAALTGVPHVCFAGSPEELPLAAGILSMASGYISNDSGLMHLAQAFNVPGAAIFGGGGEWPSYAPWAPGSAALCQPLPCFGCRWDCFVGHALCVESIPVENALKALCAAVQNPAHPPINILLDTISEPQLRLISDASARYRESARMLDERLKMIIDLDRSRESGATREAALLARVSDAEQRAAEMERIATERLSVLEEVHDEAARRLDVIHQLLHQAETRTAEDLADALAKSEAARLHLEQAIELEPVQSAEDGASLTAPIS